MDNTKYIKKNITKQWLLNNNFHYSRIFSNEDEEVYAYRFPVHKYEKFTILECELRVILGKDEVHVNVYDYNTINRYAPFYYSEYGDYSTLLKGIRQKITKELNRLEITVQEHTEENNANRINKISKSKKNKRKRNYANERK